MTYRPSSSALTAPPAELARRNGISPALATSQQARTPVPQPVKTLKGAVKVDGFPSQDRYGFAAMARDGDVWRIDHDEFGVTHHAIRLAAPKWAKANGYNLKTELHDGHIYVQFTRDGA